MSKPEYANLPVWPEADTPCVGFCSTNLGDDICMGCGRTLDEVDGWLFKTNQKLHKINRLKILSTENREGFPRPLWISSKSLGVSHSGDVQRTLIGHSVNVSDPPWVTFRYGSPRWAVFFEINCVIKWLLSGG